MHWKFYALKIIWATASKAMRVDKKGLYIWNQNENMYLMVKIFIKIDENRILIFISIIRQEKYQSGRQISLPRGTRNKRT